MAFLRGEVRRTVDFSSKVAPGVLDVNNTDHSYWPVNLSNSILVDSCIFSISDIVLFHGTIDARLPVVMQVRCTRQPKEEA